MRENRTDSIPQWDKEEPQSMGAKILMVDEATDTSLDEESFKVVPCECRLLDKDSDTSCRQQISALELSPRVKLRECFCVQEKGRTLLDAVCTGNFELLELCLDNDIHTDSTDEHGNTPLQLVSERGDLDMLSFLLSFKNINLNTRNSQGLTALSLAVINSHNKAAKMLLEHGADPNIPDNFGRTPIFFSVQNGNIEITEELIKYKADVNFVDVFDDTPISTALAGHQLLTMVKVLLCNGANPLLTTNKLNAFLETVLSCTTLERLENVKVLVESGIDINITEKFSNRNCLHMNAINGFLPLAYYLVDAGADLEQKDVSGRTPNVVAAQHGNSAVADFFLKAMCLRRIFYKERLKLVSRSLRKLTISEMFPSSTRLRE